MRPVRDISLQSGDAKEIVKEMEGAGGFTAKHLAVGVDILRQGLAEKDCLRFLSFPAAPISTGMRGIVREMVEKKSFDVLITTCGTLDHDIARSFTDYYHGDWTLDDAELREKGINRLGNVLVPDASYGEIIEKKVMEWLKDIAKEGKHELSTHELCWELGKRINNPASILYQCWKNKIPIVIPGPTDGSVGYQIWQFSQENKFKLDLLKDEQLLSDLVWTHKKSGALIIGGGISKHHVIWWNQFKDGLDWAVYITTAAEWDGSLSGARPREAVSWGKIKSAASTVTIEADATLALPLMWAALK